MIDRKPPMAMDLATILGSRSLRRAFVLTTCLALLVGSLLVLLIAYVAPAGPVWNAAVNLLTSIPASGAFALISGLYLWYFYADPSKSSTQSYVFSNDISENIEDIAKNGGDYKIFVRTGRHFRAKILPILTERARESRVPVRLEIALLDFRDDALCRRYSQYREAASFDRNSWSLGYVRTEILATVLSVLTALHNNRGLLSADLYLSGRLSTFRIEGSADSLIVTRENPNEAAHRYSRQRPEFAAYSAELRWIFEEADPVFASSTELPPPSLTELFGADVVSASLEIAAKNATDAPSPYA